jgi:hypothetical protein
MRQKAIDTANVKGWGIDADPNERSDASDEEAEQLESTPATAGRVRHNSRFRRKSCTQTSGECDGCFRTSTPPSGLSGMLRRFAFRYSESSYGHWLPLCWPDRVNEAEGVLGDLASGRVPNIPSELGWKAEWKYNRTSLVTARGDRECAGWRGDRLSDERRRRLIHVASCATPRRRERGGGRELVCRFFAACDS